MNISIYDIATHKRVTRQNVHTKKGIEILLLVGEHSQGRIERSIMSACFDMVGMNKYARNKTLNLCDRIFHRKGDTYIMPGIPRAWMFKPLYAMSGNPIPGEVRNLFGGHADDTLNQLQDEISKLEDTIKELEHEVREDDEKMDSLREEVEKWKTKAWEFYHRLQALEAESRAFQKILDDIKKMAPPAEEETPIYSMHA